jgi:hypothetical protein
MIFTHLLPQFLPELDWDELPYLSDLARAAHRESSYEALRDAIRKIQWAKFAGSEAIEFERLTENELGTLGVGALLNEPFGQLRHQKALLDFVFHAKAALDSLTVFLVERFGLALTGGDRDLRRPRCRKLIIDADEAIGAEIQRLSPWLDRSSQSVESLIAVRDDWLHRASPNVAMVQPRPDLGLFPIPKELSEPDRTRPFDPNMHLSTEEFVEFHLGRLFGLANCVIARLIEVETATLIPPPERRPQAAPTLVPLWVTDITSYTTFTLGGMTLRFLGQR